MLVLNPTSDTQNKQGSSLKGNFFHTGHRLRCVSCPRIHLLHNIRLLVLPNPNNRRMETLRLGGLHCKGFRNFLQCISLCFEVSVSLNQEAGGGGDMIPVASSEDSSTSTSSSTVSPGSDNTSKEPKIDGPQWHILRCSWFFFLATSNTLSFGFRGSSINVGLGSAIRSDVTSASPASTFFVGPPFPSPLVLLLLESCRNLVETFLPFLISKRYKSPSSLSMNSSLPGSRLLASSFKISHHHWSRTTSAIVDDCHDVSLHLRVVWEEVLLRCQLTLKICGTYGEDNSKSHVFRHLSSSTFSIFSQLE